MLASLNEDYEVDTDDLVELPQVQEMKYEMINESIKEQINDPFNSSVNFVEDFFDSLEDKMDDNEENPEVVINAKTQTVDFCLEVIKMIDDKYDLDIDMEEIETLNIDKLKGLTISLYEFFVVHYVKNLKKFFVKYIFVNKADLASALYDFKDRNDVTTNSLKDKLTDMDAVLILSNLRVVIQYINSLELNGLDLLSVFNPDRYDVYTISEAIADFQMGDGFAQQFLAPTRGESEDDNFTNIYVSISSALLKKFKK